MPFQRIRKAACQIPKVNGLITSLRSLKLFEKIFRDRGEASFELFHNSNGTEKGKHRRTLIKPFFLPIHADSRILKGKLILIVLLGFGFQNCPLRRKTLRCKNPFYVCLDMKSLGHRPINNILDIIKIRFCVKTLGGNKKKRKGLINPIKRLHILKHTTNKLIEARDTAGQPLIYGDYKQIFHHSRIVGIRIQTRHANNIPLYIFTFGFNETESMRVSHEIKQRQTRKISLTNRTMHARMDIFSRHNKRLILLKT